MPSTLNVPVPAWIGPYLTSYSACSIALNGCRTAAACGAGPPKRSVPPSERGSALRANRVAIAVIAEAPGIMPASLWINAERHCALEVQIAHVARHDRRRALLARAHQTV